MPTSERIEAQPRKPSPWAPLAWLPLPLLMAAMAALWVADPRVAWPIPPLYWLLNDGPVVLVLAFVVLPSVRGFLAQGHPGILLLGCGMWLTALGVAAAAGTAPHSLDTAWACYNPAVLLSALCQFAGVSLAIRRRAPLAHPAAWLAAAYGAGTLALGLVIWAALTGRMPAFYIPGQGGTALRGLVLGTALTLLCLTAGLLWETRRRAPSPFAFWYALGLGLSAAGLAGALLVTVRDSPLMWVTRATQALGNVYLCVAMRLERVHSGNRRILAEGLRLAWRERPLLPALRRRALLLALLRYGSALPAALVPFLARLGITTWYGPGLPTYITFFPGVMLAALLAGFGPGVLTTALAALVVDYWVLQPVGEFTVTAPMDRLGLVIFLTMGVFMSLVADLYRKARDKAGAYDREAALREMSQRLSYHVDNSPLAVIEWGPDMRLTRWSGEAERIFGWTAAEVLGRRMEDFRWIHEEDLAQVARVTQDLQSGVNPRRFSANRNYRKDGSVVHCEWYNSSLLDKSGGLRSILSLVLDVSERRRMEEALKEEGRRKDDFLALLGHELRNPLAPIGNAVYLLRMGGADRELAGRVCTIVERQVAHMSRLVDDLLDVSRINRGKIQLKAEAMDLAEAVRCVLADYRPVLEEHGLELETDLPLEPLRIRADRARIVQAVSNLLHNASKFTDPGGRVAVAVGTAEAGWAFVRVQDNGLGIRPESLGSIFEPFMQGQETMQRSHGGLGLGLALVKGLADLHGGRVTAKSEGPGLGSEFTLHLLVLAGDPCAEAPVQAWAGPVDRPRRILVVEDLADSALTLQLLLEMLGHSVAVAHDGASGLEQAERFQPEIILCDIGLPGGISGHDLARRIRAMPAMEGVHLVALSGFGTPEDKAKAARAGFAAHLTKPVDPAVLGSLIAGMPGRSAGVAHLA